MADTILLECCKISPPHNANVAEYSLPVVFFDMLFYEIPPNKSVLFFKFPCSKSRFLESIVPNLKKSLSSTLRHFLPLAGTIIHPKNGKDKPISRYVSGDSVCFTVCESESDLNHLTGNHPRICDEFYNFTPDLPPAATNLGLSSISRPVLGVQVTLFPGHGVSIGFVTHHVMADASTVLSLMKAWSLINVLDDDDEKTTRLLLEEANCLPFFDRKNVVDFNGLDSIYWDVLLGKVSTPLEPPPLKFPNGKFRSTFVLKKEEIQNLKKYVSSKRSPNCINNNNNNNPVSTFSVACALVWVCTAKSCGCGGDQIVKDDEPDYFCFVADCRRRLNPPLPDNYFGNCAALLKTELKHGELKGDDGFFMATESIGKVIRDRVYGDKGILHGAKDWPEEYGKIAGKRQCWVAGSPRFDFYGVDFGWGKPNKFEPLFIDGDGAVSLCNSREFEGGLEIGLSKPKEKMEAFTQVFTELLRDLLLP